MMSLPLALVEVAYITMSVLIDFYFRLEFWGIVRFGPCFQIHYRLQNLSIYSLFVLKYAAADILEL